MTENHLVFTKLEIHNQLLLNTLDYLPRRRRFTLWAAYPPPADVESVGSLDYLPVRTCNSANDAWISNLSVVVDQ